MPTAPQILENMHALAELAAQAPKAITMAAVSENAVEAIRAGPAGADSQIGVEDGIANILAENPTTDATFTFSFDATQNVLELRSLTTGESQGIDIGGAAISVGQEQEVVFSGLDITVVLNAAFDKTTDIEPVGGAVSATAGSTGHISSESFEVTAASEGVMDSLTAQLGVIDGTASASATISVGGFSGNADLSTTGTKSITLTDGTDSFELEFFVVYALSNGDDFDFSVNGLGAMFVIDAPSDVTITAAEGGQTLRGTNGADKLSGAGGDDEILASAGDDQIFGLAGNDSYDGGSGTDTLDLSDATSGLVVRLDLGAVRNADGDKAALNSIENVTGGNFDDIIVGNSSANRLIGRSGNDQ